MNDIAGKTRDSTDLPDALVQPMRYPFPIVWIVPLIAAIFGGYLLNQHYQGLGPKISIAFNDADGLKQGESPVQYRGVAIGQVSNVSLSPDLRHAIVVIRLKRSAASVAKKGSQFWVVRPQVDESNITGLGTVFTGPYINVEPGSGETETEFVGLEKTPLSPTERGLKLLLRTEYLDQVSVNAPVYYRGIQVGMVRNIQLSHDATSADVEVFIKRPYTKLVTANSKFWTVGGADVHGNIFRGLDLKVESLRALIAGGIAFATPSDDTPGAVAENTIFSLDSKPKDDWLKWSPHISLSEDQIKQSNREEDSNAAKTIGPALIKREK